MKEKGKKEVIGKGRIDLFIRVVHFAVMIFAIAAWLSGGGADDYKNADHFDYSLHKWLGMGLTVPIILRIIYGLIGPEKLRFSRWVPYTRERLMLAWGGLICIFLYRAPGRQAHVGIAGLIQSLGIALFLWMASTGSFIFFFQEPGQQAGRLMHFVMEIHEVGEELIPVYLGIHLGAVIIHALYGRDIWRKMLFMNRRPA